MNHVASVKKLERLAFGVQQFGHEYADVRQSTGRRPAAGGRFHALGG
jgi:hypothetical protein